MEKEWYKSKGIWGGIFITIGGVIVAVGQFLQGSLDFATLINQVVPLIGAGLGIIGIRDKQG